MQLYSPSISIQTKEKIKWTIKNFKNEFNKTETDLMMLEDGISESSWLDLITIFRAMAVKDKMKRG